MGDFLKLGESEHKKLWDSLEKHIHAYQKNLKNRDVYQPTDLKALSTELQGFNFEKPRDSQAVLDFVFAELEKTQLHHAHTGCYGVFNPNPSTMGLIADATVAVFNPQLATSLSSPFGVAVEEHLIQFWGKAFGLKNCEGIFTSGGTEANHTAILTALTHQFETYLTEGLAGLRPVLYCSTEAHHSILKMARMCGLGSRAVREVNAENLKEAIQKDRSHGFQPFLVVGTLGTTSGGEVEPLGLLSQICREEKLWFHIDAAWAGAAAILPEYENYFAACQHADSITLDAHKWLSVPMGAGIFLTSKLGILESTFRVDTSFYMPQISNKSEIVEMYSRSLQWSRRFIGLKLFMTMAVAGIDKYRETLRHQIKMGELLRALLKEKNWQIANDTPFPVICFYDERVDSDEFLKKVKALGKVWITSTQLTNRLPNQTVLRVGITNFETQERDIHFLASHLDEIRKKSIG